VFGEVCGKEVERDILRAFDYVERFYGNAGRRESWR
jgi:hypothetical protein